LLVVKRFTTSNLRPATAHCASCINNEPTHVTALTDRVNASMIGIYGYKKLSADAIVITMNSAVKLM